jgi:hypothetical protein
MSYWVIYTEKCGIMTPKAHQCDTLEEANIWAEENQCIYAIEDISKSCE